MRAFSILSIAAAAALSLIPSAFAAPVVDVDAAVAADAKVHARLLDVDTKADAIADVHVRDTSCLTILTDLYVDLGVSISELSFLTSANATTETITPILTTVVSVIGDAVVEIQALTGCSDSVSDCACVLAEILSALCGVLVLLLGIVADVQILLDVIVKVALGGCLCELISAVISVMDGLLVVLIPLVLSLASSLLALGLGAVGSLLTIC